MVILTPSEAEGERSCFWLLHSGMKTRVPIRGPGRILGQFPADSIVQFHVVLLQQIAQRMIQLNSSFHVVAPRCNLSSAGLS